MESPWSVVNVVFAVVGYGGFGIFLLVVITRWLRGSLKSRSDTFREKGLLADEMHPSASRPKTSHLIVLGLIGALVYVLLLPFLVNTVDELHNNFSSGLLFFAAIAVVSAPVWGWTLALTYLFVRMIVDRRIARAMSEQLPAGSGSVPRATAQVPAGRGRPIELITALADDGPEKRRIRKSANVLGQKPLRMLYLWNFDAGLADRLMTRSLREYGPLYMLSSPRCIPMHVYFMLLFTGPASWFANDRAAVDRWLNEADETPLGRGLRGGRFGRYPEISVPCNDAVWQTGVIRLCEHVDAIIFDARGFSAERDGLGWELDYVVKKIDGARLILIADLSTDMKLVERRVQAAAAGAQAGGAIRIVNLCLGQPVKAFIDDGMLVMPPLSAAAIVGLVATQ